MNIKRDLSNLFHLVILRLKRQAPKGETINKVRFISFRHFFPHGGAGGGGAVQSANKVIFRDRLGSTPVCFSFWDLAEYRPRTKSQVWDLLQAYKFTQMHTQHDEHTAYITHDYGTAFALYLMGKPYILICHIQGPRVEEKTNFGEPLSATSKRIIQYAERCAFANAHYVSFPSKGAYEYFCKSPHKTLRDDEFRLGPILYNTLYAFPTPVPVENIDSPPDAITVLSVGQLTAAKGMDRHPSFFKKLLSGIEQRLHYIMVGQGPLEASILAELRELQRQYPHFTFTHLPRCSYPQIQYLQQSADVYLMLHRLSIFDLATLEMMHKGKAVILSPAGGNPEFNRKDNIILIKDEDISHAMLAFRDGKLPELGRKNKEVFDQYFSQEAFRARYQLLVDDLIMANKQESRIQ